MVAAGIASAPRPSPSSEPAGAPDDPTVTGGHPATEVTPPHDPMHALLQALLQRVAPKPKAPPVATDTPPGAPAAPDGFSDAPPLERLPCFEVTAQAQDPTRRAAQARDPLEAMDKAAFHLCRLEADPTRAEDVTRSLEALVGAAQQRVARTYTLGGIPGWQTYAAYYDEILRALHTAKRFTQTSAARTLDADTLLDADREGRILFWLGDRPDVEAMLDGKVGRPADVSTDSVTKDAAMGGPARVLAPDHGQPLRITPLFAGAAPEDGPFADPEFESVAGASE